LIAVFLPILLGFSLLGFVAEGLIYVFSQTRPRPLRYDYHFAPYFNTSSATAVVGLVFVVMLGWDYSLLVASHPQEYAAIMVGWMMGRAAFIRSQNNSFFENKNPYALRD